MLPLPPAPSPIVYRHKAGEKAAYAAELTVVGGKGRMGLKETISTETLSIAPDGTAELRVRFTARKPSGIPGMTSYPDFEKTLKLDRYGRVESIETLKDDARVFALSLRIPPVALEAGKEAEIEDGVPYDLPDAKVYAVLKSLRPDRAEWTYRATSDAQKQTFARRVLFDPGRGLLLSARLEAVTSGVKAAMTLDRR